VCLVCARLEVGLLEVDVLPDLALQNLEEQLAVRVPAVFPQAVQQVVARLRACTGSSCRRKTSNGKHFYAGLAAIACGPAGRHEQQGSR